MTLACPDATDDKRAADSSVTRQATCLADGIRSEALLTEARRFVGAHPVCANLDVDMLVRLTDALGDAELTAAEIGALLS